MSIYHWLVVALVIVILFGTKKLRNVGSDLGAAVKGFKKAMQEDDKADADFKSLNNDNAAQATREESKQKDQA
ncbi:MAG: Sec-independent protein translocase subunit TatA [Pasteurellaceae bacterium]|nr:Sec-independent protein translocase subunit TatA [Pasteurellaceae bacterium]